MILLEEEGEEQEDGVDGVDGVGGGVGCPLAEQLLPLALISN